MRITISRQSWHYRLFGFYDSTPPSNLCPYFWKVIGMSLALPFWLMILAPASMGSNKPYVYREHWYDGKIWMFGLIAMIGFDIFIYSRGGFPLSTITYMIIRGAIWGFERVHWERKPKEKKPKEPNLLVEYLKAKKHRFCPLLEFKN